MRDKEPAIFDDLYHQYKYLGLPVNLICRDTNFTIFNLADIKEALTIQSPVHRLNFFVFAFVKDGQGSYTIEEQKFEIRPGTVYFTNPGHYRSFNWKEINDAYLITLSESFIKEHVHGDVFDEFPFLLSESFPARVLTPEVYAEFERLYLQIYKEYISHSPFRSQLIANLFIVLLLKVKEYFWLDYNPIYEGNRSSQIVKNFRRLLEKHYRDLSSGEAERAFRVQDYADDQNLHPNYLSSVIKTKTGKAIGNWIAEKTISEAKSLLRNSSLTVKEIAYRLRFGDAAHFSNYFKKHTNLSPATYRKAQI
jgi:AraC family transcriptional activator of pobA